MTPHPPIHHSPDGRTEGPGSFPGHGRRPHKPPEYPGPGLSRACSVCGAPLPTPGRVRGSAGILRKRACSAACARVRDKRRKEAAGLRVAARLLMERAGELDR